VKKIDGLLLKAFIGPFLATFFITMFVLVMQFLWLFIDDIVGKGVSIGLVLELLFYSSLSLIPMALPIAVCISSVMVIGDLAEHYELSSLKSAGVSFLRILAPLIAITFLISCFSFFCSNNLIPVSKLKLKTRLKDIKSSKGILSLEEGIFNADFSGFVIHIGKKESDGRGIRDVLVYNNALNQDDQVSVITAKRGEIFHSDDGQYLIMNLYDGIQYQEPKSEKKNEEIHTFSRTYFKEWNKVFSLSEFEVPSSSSDRNKNNYAMMSYGQLSKAIDSLDRKIAGNYNRLAVNYNRHLKISSKGLDKPSVISSIEKPEQNSPKGYFLKTLPKDKYKKHLQRAKSQARNIRDQANAAINKISYTKELRVKHIFEQQSKISMALVCLLFLFIGGSMGAIIRKGGFGYPILIAISFFLFFMILQMFFKKLGESFVLQAEYAPWIPCLVLLPIALFLSHRAMFDKL
jgi:lipopolysaccharide export system permease protein